ncbi:hypothetical protein, partial [Cloacibacillus porcorum]|uniref:hypothetical protein n=1 Tax=Cloacibacillus porcorum TaxID=1197717 RepID=UPI0026719BDF
GATKVSILFFRRIVNPFEPLFYKDTRPRVLSYFTLVLIPSDFIALCFLLICNYDCWQRRVRAAAVFHRGIWQFLYHMLYHLSLVSSCF